LESQSGYTLSSSVLKLIRVECGAFSSAATVLNSTFRWDHRSDHSFLGPFELSECFIAITKRGIDCGNRKRKSSRQVQHVKHETVPPMQ
jgi:hypothetical protein